MINDKIIGFKNDSSLNNYFVLNYFAKNKIVHCQNIKNNLKSQAISKYGLTIPIYFLKFWYGDFNATERKIECDILSTL